MPAIRDWSFNYISTAGTSVVCDGPETAAGDLLVAEVTCKVATNTVTAPPPGFLSFETVTRYGYPVETKTLYAGPSNGVTISAADGTTNLPQQTATATPTAPSKSLWRDTELGTANSWYPTAPTQGVETIMHKWYYQTTYAYDVDFSAISYSLGVRVYNTTDTLIVRLYGHDPAGAANNKTLISTGTVKTPGVTTLVQVAWAAGDFTNSGTGRLTAGYMLLVELSMTRVGTTTTAPRFYHGTTGTTASQNITFTTTGTSLGYFDVTTAAGNATVGDVQPISALVSVVNEAIYLGASSTFTKAQFQCSTAGAGGSSASTWEYYNGSTWATLSTLTDTTANWRLSTGLQSITFTAPGDWTTYAVNSVTHYWIRSRVSTSGTFTTKPLLTYITNGDTRPWTELYNVYQGTTPAQIVLWRYATATEPDTHTFGLGTSTVCSMAMISVRDVHATAPIDGYATNNTSSAVKANMPTRSASAGCLNLHFVSTSVAAIPSILEGPVTQLFAKDGGACSDGCGWSYTPTAATTPTVGMSKVAASTDVLATVSIAPPASGPTVVPTYCAADASVYLTPIQGVTAYNGDTAFAATATTYFGTLLNGKTLANGTATARADVGINSYHSMGDCQSGTTKGTWSGCTNVFATGNKPNVSGKNVLVHAKPYLPVDLQTTVGISGVGVCGVALGLCSTANTDYRVFHVSGGGTPWGAATQPVIINDTYAGAGRIQNTGTLAPSSVLALGFFVSGFLVAANWMFGSAWVLDTTTIAGGTETEPVTPASIVQAAADGHERLSVTRQGINQILVFQPIQFGNGGTNPLYLSLRNSATEFPKQYEVTSKTTNYCAPDNVCGYTFYPGADDHIDLRGAIISSASRYHFGLHASTSTASSWLTDGMAVVGAGTLTLNKALTFTGMTINDYTTLDVSGLTFDGGSILGCPTTNDSLTTSSTTLIKNSSIDVSALPAGNRWCSVASPVIFEDNAFTGGGGHAMRITTAGSYTFHGNTFTGFGANGSTGAAILNDSGGLVTLTITGGGGNPSIKNGSGATTTVVFGQVDATLTVKDVAGENIENARALVLAAAGGPFPCDVTVTIVNSGTTATVTHTAHGLATGDKVQIKGASLAENNGVWSITYISADSYSYTMGSSPGSSPTGTIKATFAVLSGLTDANGQITMTRTFASAQPITGRVRKSTSAPYYKTTTISGSISNTTGWSATVQLLPDA